jgi:hypothetical protein
MLAKTIPIPNHQRKRNVRFAPAKDVPRAAADLQKPVPSADAAILT